MHTFLKRIEVLIIVAAIGLLGTIYGLTRKASAPKTAYAPNAVEQFAEAQRQKVAGAQTTEITYPGQDGKNALQLLQSGHQVELKHFSFGDQVMAIDGVKPDEKTAYWEFIVNDKSAEVGASSYVTKSSDTIKWRVSKLTN